MTAKGDYFPSRVNSHFLNAKYAADVGTDGIGKILIPAMVALDADGILAAASINAALDTTTFASTYAASKMGKFGRNVTVVASGAATSTVIVYGKDYLGQPMSETLTLNGNTPVLGVKAFKHVLRVVGAVTSSTTINVGWGNVFGLPYKILKLLGEFVSSAEASSAGAVVKGVDTTQTATTTDPRGTYAPHSSNISDGTKYWEILAQFDGNNLYGVAHFTA